MSIVLEKVVHFICISNSTYTSHVGPQQQNLKKMAFCGLANLQYLNLSNNNISTFQYDMFVHIHKTLLWLNIKNNHILEAKYEDSNVLCKVIVITNDNNLCCLLSKHLDKSCILIKERCFDKICQNYCSLLQIWQ